MSIAGSPNNRHKLNNVPDALCGLKKTWDGACARPQLFQNTMLVDFQVDQLIGSTLLSKIMIKLQ